MLKWNLGFPGGSVVKNPPASAGDVGLIPGSGRTPGEWNGDPLQYFCLENPMDRGTWQVTVYGDAKSWTEFSSTQLISHVQLFVNPWTTARQASPSITSSLSLLKLISIGLVMPSNHLILCCPLLLLPPIPPSIRVFSNESALRMRWPKYWSFSFSISPSNEHPGLISSRMDWLDILAVQGTLKSLLQHHSSRELDTTERLSPHTQGGNQLDWRCRLGTCTLWEVK